MAVPDAYPFRRLTVLHSVRGGARVFWELERRFDDPRPHRFRLEVASCPAPGPGDWQATGLAAEDPPFLADAEQRDFGKSLDHHWRLVLSTPLGTYASKPVRATEGLGHRDWRLAREMLRQARKRAGKFTGVPVLLFARRRYGPPCETCLDPHTGEPTRLDCPECFGTGVRAGYHRAQGGYFMDLGLESAREQLDDLRAVGTDKPVAVTAELHGLPLVRSKDVLAEGPGGRRWFVETVKETAALRGYAFKHQAEIRLAPYTDPVYDVPEEGS